MAEDRNDFLSRWSRRKLGGANAEAAPATPAPAPANAVSGAAAAPAPLPSPETLGIDSDFTAFMRGEVDEGVRRAALKKLFADPRFNVMDGLDIYIDDYSIENPIPPGMLARLEHSRGTLIGTEERERAHAQSAAQETAAPQARQVDSAPGATAPVQPEEKNGDPGQDPEAV
ncbi:MAG: DUF3306 domain-containing protein [Betaproteobacteria bacterium]|nr:DUF3306 domain-containing protein [Betaproteobacteria bacterium]